MLYLLACIALNTLLVVLFREFRRFDVGLLPVITINYWVCLICGFFWNPDYWTIVVRSDPAWLPLAVVIGVLFIGMFMLIGTASQQMGVTYTMMIIKLSVVVPTLLSIVVFHDAMTPLRWLGVGLALVAIVLLHMRYRGAAGLPASQTWIRIVSVGAVLFLGSGLIDTLFKVFYERYDSMIPANVFIMSLFGVSAMVGSLVVAWQAGRGTLRGGWQNWVAGLALGVPNYFSILTLLLAIRLLPGTVFFPVNNIGQLMLTSLVGLALYREYMPRLSQVGMALALLAIFLIAYDQLAPYLAGLFAQA